MFHQQYKPSRKYNRNSYASKKTPLLAPKLNDCELAKTQPCRQQVGSQSSDSCPKWFDSIWAIPKNGRMRFFSTKTTVLLLCTFASACSLLFPDRTAPKSASYTIIKPKGDWSKIAVSEATADSDSLRADIAFENKKTGGIISLNSICRKYNRYTLEELTLNLVRGIENKEEVEKMLRKIDGADALDTLFSGIVDKVKVNIRTVVLIKNNCTYDFLHVVVPQKNYALDPEFDRFIESFRTE